MVGERQFVERVAPERVHFCSSAVDGHAPLERVGRVVCAVELGYV